MKTIALLIPASLMLFASCSDDNDVTETPNPGPTYTGMTDFFTRNAVPVQHFTVDASVTDTVTGSKGTVIIFPGGGFVDANNNAVTGNVDISLQEIYSNKDMFLSNVYTIEVYERPLISGGMINLQASKNGMPLQRALFSDYVAKFPKQQADPNLWLFTGVVNSSGVLLWSFDSIENGVINNNSTPPYCYIVEYNYFGWINCDDFADISGPNITVTVNTTNNPNPDSTIGNVWVNNLNGMWRLDQSGSNHASFGSSRMKDMPVTFITTTISNGKIFAGFRTETSLTNNAVYSINMQEMTDAAYKAALDSLE